METILFLQASGLSLEWTTIEGRTFIATGGGVQYWERFLREDQHPTRTAVSSSEIARALGEAHEPFTLFSVRKDELGVERLTREQLLDRVEEFERAKRDKLCSLCGQTFCPAAQEDLCAECLTEIRLGEDY